MKPCPSCGYIVPRAWTECRRCGTALEFVSSDARGPAQSSWPTRSPATVALMLAPLPGVPDLHPLPSPDPDTMLPPEPLITVARAPQKSGLDGRTIAIIAMVAVCVIGGVFSLVHNGGQHAATPPTVLAPVQPSAGIPTSLSDVVRIAAESSRHTALSTVMSVHTSVATPITIAELATAQPNYQWVTGDQPSTTNTIISVTSVPGFDVLAVSGTSKEVCAFGRWSPSAGPEYVTMAHVPTCAASAAPVLGWSSIAGGSAQDLPDPNAF